MVIEQSIPISLTQEKKKPFALMALEGNIGKAIIETYFCHYKYETYPFGYENHFSNVTRYIKRDPSNTTITKVRAMPDLLVFDRKEKESYLVEIKTCKYKNPSDYWMDKRRLNTYKKYWPEAILVVYFASCGRIYCNRISEIEELKERTFSNQSDNRYYPKLDDFHYLPYYFEKMNRKECDELQKQIQTILHVFEN